jgi:hypothetical protein
MKLQNIRFIVSPSKEVSLHRKPASGEGFRAIRAHWQDKTDTVCAITISLHKQRPDKPTSNARYKIWYPSTINSLA